MPLSVESGEYSVQSTFHSLQLMKRSTKIRLVMIFLAEFVRYLKHLTFGMMRFNRMNVLVIPSVTMRTLH